MKAERFMLATIFSAFLLFIGSSLFTGMTAKEQIENETKPAIVFDLGGVVFTTDKGKLIQPHFGGYSAFLGYALRNKCIPSSNNIKKAWFETINKIFKANGHTLSHPATPCDEEGNVVPHYMIEWLAGTMKGQDIYEEIERYLNNDSSLKSNSDKLLMLRMSKIFLDDVFVSSRKLIAETSALITTLKEQEYKLYVLSNWDDSSFKLLQEQYPDLFAQFDGIVLSGDVNIAKPEKDIYLALERQYPHAQYLFLDDQEENITAAKIMGWKTIKIKHGQPDRKKILARIHKVSDEMTQQAGRMVIG